MKLDSAVTQTTSSVFTSIALSFLWDSIGIMIPWLIVMFAVIVTESAVRRTMGKMVTYFSWVVMVCLVESAVGDNSDIAKWACLLVIAMEVGSIISNLLKPHGIDISASAVLKFFFMHTPISPSREEADEIIVDSNLEQLREKEREKWKHRSKKQ